MKIPFLSRLLEIKEWQKEIEVIKTTLLHKILFQLEKIRAVLEKKPEPKTSQVMLYY